MRCRTKAGAILLAVAAFGVVLFTVLPTNRGEGPVTSGRHLSEWVGSRTSDGELFFKAQDAVIATGSNAFPYILRWIQSEETPRRYKLPRFAQIFIMNHSSLEHWLRTSTERRTQGAQDAFCLLGTNAPPQTITELVRLMNATNMPQTRFRAASILPSTGTNGLPALVAVLENPTQPLRWLVVRLFFVDERLASSSQAAVPGLIQCLKDPTRQTAAVAAAALGKMKASPELTVPALLSCLDSPDPHLRRSAAEALRTFPDQAALSRPPLTSLLTDPDETVRNAGTNSLKQIAPEVLTNATTRF